MKYETFAKLYTEAKYDYEDVELYVAERGWQEWMDQEDPDKIGDMLIQVYHLANLDTVGLRNELKMSRAEFSRQYRIPARTLQDWDFGERKPPEYVMQLMAYAILNGLEGTNEQN